MVTVAGVKRKVTDDQARGVSSKIQKKSPFVRQRDITSIKVPETSDMEAQIRRIAASDRTLFEKKVWTLLCQIPQGHFSTYGVMAAHLNSSPRAIGNAMRRNPFAPEVPCHRCVATGGRLGGFKGQWPKNGEGITLDEKRSLLRQEGVKFDGTGRVVGTPFAAFV
jgi:methylated-DNA-[protein]-cysteine S-methyltransferase